MKSAYKTLFFLSICIAPGAHATIFMCKDASGRTITSDRPIPECAERTVWEYGNTGSLKREIAAPLTAGDACRCWEPNEQTGSCGNSCAARAADRPTQASAT